MLVYSRLTGLQIWKNVIIRQEKRNRRETKETKDERNSAAGRTRAQTLALAQNVRTQRRVFGTAGRSHGHSYTCEGLERNKATRSNGEQERTAGSTTAGSKVGCKCIRQRFYQKGSKPERKVTSMHAQVGHGRVAESLASNVLRTERRGGALCRWDIGTCQRKVTPSR